MLSIYKKEILLCSLRRRNYFEIYFLNTIKNPHLLSCFSHFLLNVQRKTTEGPKFFSFQFLMDLHNWNILNTIFTYFRKCLSACDTNFAAAQAQTHTFVRKQNKITFLSKPWNIVTVHCL